MTRAHSSARTHLLLAILLFSALPVGASAEDNQPCERLADPFPVTSTEPISAKPSVDFLSAAAPYIDSLTTVCAAADVMPHGYWRESFFSRRKEQLCSDATILLHEVFQPVLEGAPSVNFSDPAQNTAVRGYVEACVTSLAEVTDPNGGYGKCLDPKRTNILTYMHHSGEVDRLLQSVGDLRPIDSSFDCAATIVTVQSGARFLVTAAHCAIDGESGKVHKDLQFLSYSGFSINLDLSETASAAEGREINWYGADVAMFPLNMTQIKPESIGIPMVSVSPEAYTPLYLVGKNPYAVPLLQNDGVSELDRPKEFIAITFDRSCVLLGRREGHIFHNCQTQGGMSGAPILVSEGGRFHIAGVHTGGKRNLNDLCDTRSVKADNYGVALLDR